jgi:UDPglucose 6-dehydrogenase
MRVWAGVSHPGDEPDKPPAPVSGGPSSTRIAATPFPQPAQELPAMRVTVIGAGHVGLVTAACLAHAGHDVLVDDDDPGKLELIRKGRSWFFEPELDGLLGEVVGAGRLRVAGGKAEAVRHGVVVFVCVGTPPRGDGSPNLAYVEAVAREVARNLPAGEFRVVCEKSTVPVQTGERVAQVIAREAPPGADWEVASNPEFLREGSAVADTLRPDRVVVGSSSERGLAVLRELYEPILEGSTAPFLATDRATAELIKHASNAFLATKISFINSVARVCERSGADVEVVAAGMGLDPRIGASFLNAGAGYGGSCFPKDVAAFAHRSRELGVEFGILNEVAKVNHEARHAIVGKVRDVLWHLDGKRIGVLGLTFKPDTDDLRDAPAIDVVTELLADGARVVAFDPVAGEQAAEQVPGLELAGKAAEVADDAHALVLMTEWAEFNELDPRDLRARMAYPILIDARNALDADAFVAAGFTVAGVGRPVRTPDRGEE